MTQEELKDNLITTMWGRRIDPDVSLIADDLRELINQHVADVIGEDVTSTPTTYEASSVKTIVNNVKADMRRRAGL